MFLAARLTSRFQQRKSITQNLEVPARYYAAVICTMLPFQNLTVFGTEECKIHMANFLTLILIAGITEELHFTGSITQWVPMRTSVI